jgi:hypothetical protein
MAKRPAVHEAKDTNAVWLPVIGRALAFLCLKQAQQIRPEDFVNVLDKVKFLTDLGLPEADAAHGAGSNLQSVRVMKSALKRRKARGRARKK